MDEKELIKTMVLLIGDDDETVIESIVVKWSGLTIPEFVEEVNNA